MLFIYKGAKKTITGDWFTPYISSELTCLPSFLTIFNLQCMTTEVKPSSMDVEVSLTYYFWLYFIS